MERKLLFVVSASLGELDTHLPLFVRLRRSEDVATTVLFTRSDLHRKYRQSPGYLALEKQGVMSSAYSPVDGPLPSELRNNVVAAAGIRRAMVHAAAAALDAAVNFARRIAWAAQRVLHPLPELSAYQAISVEFEGGTASFEFFRGYCGRHGRKLLAHHHAVSMNEVMPTRAPAPAIEATGISTYDSEANRALFRSLGIRSTVYVGCTKLYPEWLSLVDAVPFPQSWRGHVVLFLKKLHRPEFRAMTDDLAALLRESFPGLEVVIKVHPRESIARYRDYARSTGLKSVHVVFEPNFIVLRQALCALSLPGTAILDSYAQGVPCIEYHRPYDPGSGYAPITLDSRLAGFPAVDRIDQVREFVESCRAGTWRTPEIVARLRQIPDFRLLG